MSSTDTITLLVVLALGLSSSGFSSSELSSSEGAGTGLTSPVSTGTGQSGNIVWKKSSYLLVWPLVALADLRSGGG